MGKTWLSRHLLEAAGCRSVRVAATTRTDSLVASIPLSPGLRGWVEKAREKLVRGHHLEPEQAVGTLAALLERLAPFIVQVEDLDEASPERLELWTALARALSPGVILIATSRTPPPAPFENHRVEPLSAEASAALLQRQGPHELPEEATTWIYTRAQGNPLFTLEYYRYLTRQGYLWSDGRLWRWRSPPAESVPPTVEALIAQGLVAAADSPQVQAVLGARALLPADASQSLWIRVAQVSPAEFEEVRARLERAGILLGQRFIHPLFGEVARSQLDPSLHRVLARRALEALETGDSLEAVRYLEAAQLDPEQALKLLERASEAALAQGKGLEALALLTRAVTLAQGPARARLARMALKSLRGMDRPESVHMAQKALEIDPDCFEAVYALARSLALQEHTEEAVAKIEAFSGMVTAEERLLAHIHVRIIGGDGEGALAVWNAHPEIHASPLIRPILHALGAGLAKAGRQAEAKRFLLQALERTDLNKVQRIGLMQTYANRLGQEGDYKGADDCCTQALQILAEVEPDPAWAVLSRRWKWSLLFSRGSARMGLGQLQEALEDYRAAMDVATELGNGQQFAQAQAVYAECLLELGYYEQAEEALLESLRVLGRAESSRSIYPTEYVMARLYLEWPPPARTALALRHARVAVDHLRKANIRPELARVLPVLARARIAVDDVESALEHLAEAESIALRISSPVLQAQIQWVRGLALEQLGRREEAVASLQQAVSLVPGCAPLLTERIGLDHDRLTGNWEAGRSRTQRLESLGAKHAAAVGSRCFWQETSAQAAGKEAVQPPVSLAVLGTLEVRVAGTRVTELGQMARELLTLLLEARMQGLGEVPDLELLDALYSGWEERKALGALRSLIYRTRSLLGAAVILRTGGGYALGAATSDAEEFLRSKDTRLWRGPYLGQTGKNAGSLIEDRLYMVLRERAWGLLESDPEEALRLSYLLLEADPYAGDALSLGLRALLLLDNPGAAERFYRRHCRRFTEVGEQLPLRWQEFLDRNGVH
nr:hypothetical protein [Calidithermus terrae]